MVAVRCIVQCRFRPTLISLQVCCSKYCRSKKCLSLVLHADANRPPQGGTSSASNAESNPEKKCCIFQCLSCQRPWLILPPTLLRCARKKVVRRRLRKAGADRGNRFDENAELETEDLALNRRYMLPQLLLSSQTGTLTKRGSRYRHPQNVVYDTLLRGAEKVTLV